MEFVSAQVVMAVETGHVFGIVRVVAAAIVAGEDSKLAALRASATSCTTEDPQ